MTLTHCFYWSSLSTLAGERVDGITGRVSDNSHSAGIMVRMDWKQYSEFLV